MTKNKPGEKNCCSKCNGIDGVYVKICEDTGEIIETYKEQLIRQTKGLIGKNAFVEPDGSKQ